MRTIKFRGKRIDNGEWVEGDLIQNYNGKKRIVVEEPQEPEGDLGVTNNEVHPETVGQYTGLKDKNGKEIYCGDVFKIGGIDVAVEFRDGCYFIGHLVLALSCDHREITGTIHDKK